MVGDEFGVRENREKLVPSNKPTVFDYLTCFCFFKQTSQDDTGGDTRPVITNLSAVESGGVLGDSQSSLSAAETAVVVVPTDLSTNQRISLGGVVGSPPVTPTKRRNCDQSPSSTPESVASVASVGSVGSQDMNVVGCGVNLDTHSSVQQDKVYVRPR